MPHSCIASVLVCLSKLKVHEAEMQPQNKRTKPGQTLQINKKFRNILETIKCQLLTFSFVSDLSNLNAFENQDKYVNQFSLIKQKVFSL